MSRLLTTFPFQAAVVTLLGVIIGAVLAGWQAQSRVATPTSAAAAAAQQPGTGGAAASSFRGAGAGSVASGTPAAGPGIRAGAAGGQRPIVGAIDAIEPTRIVVQHDNQTTTAALDDATIVRRVESISRSDLTVGASVTVMGASGADGAIAATTVQLLPADSARPGPGQAFGGPANGQSGGQGTGPANGQSGGPGGTQRDGQQGGAASGRGMSFGTIEQLTDSGFTVSSMNGVVAVQVGDNTSFHRIVDAKVADLQAGERVMLLAQPGQDGTMTARSIQVGEFDAGQGQPSTPAP